MAYKLSDGTYISIDSPFTLGDINYPANWLRLATNAEKKELGITWEADPVPVNEKFYEPDGSAKSLADYNEYYQADAEDGSYKKGDPIKDEEGNVVVYKGVKSLLKQEEKQIAASLLSMYDWYVVRKVEKGTAIPSTISTFRDAVRTACDTREKEIDACADTAALIKLYESTEKDGVATPNMTQYPVDPNI